MKREKFWIIFGPKSKRVGDRTYQTRNSAEEVAKRFAHEEVGKDFFVMESVGGVGVSNPEIVQFRVQKRENQ